MFVTKHVQAAKAVFLCLLLSSCTTIHVYSEGDVQIEANRVITTNAEAGL